MRKKLTEKQLLQKQWDNWCDEQFVYMKKWALEIADYISCENILDDWESKCDLKIQSIIMQSMLG